MRGSCARRSRALRPLASPVASDGGAATSKRSPGASTWSTTPILGEAFGRERLSVDTMGNVLAANAFLQGLAAEELAAEELDATDTDYPVIVMARVCKGAAGA